MSRNNTYQTIVSTIFLTAVLLFTLVTHDNLHILLTAGFLMIQGFFIWRKILPSIFFFLIPFTVFVYMLGSQYTFDLYRQIEWYDNVVHLLATCVITLLIGMVGDRTSLKSLRSQPFVYILVIASLGISLGVLWEIVEWLLDTFIRTIQLITVYDVITDLMFDSLSALIAGFLSYRYKQ